MKKNFVTEKFSKVQDGIHDPNLASHLVTDELCRPVPWRVALYQLVTPARKHLPAWPSAFHL